jgi:hypothetical protein
MIKVHTLIGRRIDMKSIVNYVNQKLEGENIVCTEGNEGFTVHIQGKEEKLPVLFMKINPDLHMANKEALSLKKEFPYARYGILLNRNITGEIIRNGQDVDFFEVISLEEKDRIVGLIRNEVDVLLNSVQF